MRFTFMNRWRMVLTRLYFLLLLIFSQPRWLFFFLGLPLVILGLAQRVWAAGTIEKKKSLCTSGPYAICRHPLYFGTFLSGLGFTTIAGALPIFYTAFLLLFLAFYFPVMKQEEKDLAVAFPEPWKDYIQHTPLFLPSSLPYSPTTHAGFRFRLFLQNKEWEGVLLSVLLLLLLLLFLFTGVTPLTFIKGE